MKLAVMQPYFLPYIGYFQAINEVDKYILYSNLTFIKDGWMNRNRILIKNGAVSTISVPLLSKSSNFMINDVRIDNSQLWKNKMLKTFFLNYKGSKYFDEFFPCLSELLNEPIDFLSDLNSHLIVNLSKLVGINTEIEFNNYEKYAELEEKLLSIDKGDFSTFKFMEQTRPIKKVARVLEIAKNEKATVFINAIGGQDLYSKEEFSAYNIDLKFIKTNHFSYKQFKSNFNPNLSIVDVLMHNGKQGTLDLIKNYELV
jgi:hypothetical protein